MNADDQEQRFDQWLARHKGLLLKVLRAYARTPHDQEDLFQEITFQLWRSLPNYSEEVAETTWTYRVAMYTAIGWLRKEGNRKRRSYSLDGGQVPCFHADRRVSMLYVAFERAQSTAHRSAHAYLASR